MPRSPSRDRSDRFTGFRGYVRVPDRLARAKTAALLSAGVLVGLWVVVEMFTGAGVYHTHGALANPHAAWDNDCAACHHQYGLANFSLSNVFDARERWHNLTCTKCHAGTPHHTTVKNEPDGTSFHDRCSNCHHDHGGRTTSLTSLTDNHCVRCHEKLPEHHVAGAANYESLSSFAGNHPEFKALRDYPAGKDYAPRKLKFSHAVHMTPGIVYQTTTGTTAKFTLERIKELSKSSPEAAARYREFDTPEGIALKCAACHVLDARVPDKSDPKDAEREGYDRIADLLKGQPKASILPPRAEGAYYLPMNFDANCKACHPTIVPDGMVTTNGGMREVAGFTVPHRLQMAEAEPLVRGGYWAKLMTKVEPAAAKGNLPGGRLDPAPTPDVVTTYGGEIDRLTRAGLAWMVTDPQPEKDENRPGVKGAACAKCHYFTGEGKSAKVEPLPQHTVWFAHAKFNHVSHRGLTCASCHPGTEKPATPPATRVKGSEYTPEPIAILGVKSCQACHAPAGTRVDQADGTKTVAGGIRHGCTDCHRYHNGDRPLHGMGSPLRDPQPPHAPLSLADFLGGGKKK